MHRRAISFTRVDPVEFRNYPREQHDSYSDDKDRVDSQRVDRKAPVQRPCWYYDDIESDVHSVDLPRSLEG